MKEKCVVFRMDEFILKGIEEFNYIERLMDKIDVKDKYMIFNIELRECLELYNLMEKYKVIFYFVVKRKESRGVYGREDDKERDESKWLVDFLLWFDNKVGVRMGK
jgi:Succinate dehydrogenase/fumarate reductase, flavoprotein subunit